MRSLASLPLGWRTEGPMVGIFTYTRACDVAKQDGGPQGPPLVMLDQGVSRLADLHGQIPEGAA